MVTFQGVVASGQDSARVLPNSGAGGPTNLAGLGFTLTYTIDIDSPDVDIGSFTSATTTLYTLGFGFNAPVSAVMTIDGLGLDHGVSEYGGATNSYDAPGDDYFVSQILHEYEGTRPIFDGSGDIYRTYSNASIYSEVTGHDVLPVPFSFATPFSYNFQTGDVSFGEFYLYREDEFGNSDLVLNASLNVRSVTVENTALGGIPEPQTWALMIGGFALAGATLRRRRQAPA